MTACPRSPLTKPQVLLDRVVVRCSTRGKLMLPSGHSLGVFYLSEVFIIIYFWYDTIKKMRL